MTHIAEIKINSWNHFQFDESISLKTGINLLLGKNGSGKTSLLKMIQAASSKQSQPIITEFKDKPNGTRLVVVTLKDDENDISISNEIQGSEGRWTENNLQTKIRFITSQRSVTSGSSIKNPFASSMNLDISNANLGETIDVAEEFNKSIIKELIDTIKSKVTEGIGFIEGLQRDYQSELVDFEKILRIDPSKENAVYFEDHKGREVPINSLSSGEKEYLYFYAYLRRIKSDEDKIILIDEPELHLHNSQIKKLCELIGNLASKNQIIIATHSGEILQYFISQANLVLLSKNKIENITNTDQMRKILEETGLPIDPSVFTAHWICAENEPTSTINNGPTTPEILRWIFGKNINKRYWSFGSNRAIAQGYADGITTVSTPKSKIQITPILDGDKLIKTAAEYFPSSITDPSREIAYFPFWEIENIFLSTSLLEKLIPIENKKTGSERFWSSIVSNKERMINQIKKTVAKNNLRKFSIDKYVNSNPQDDIESWKNEISKISIDLSLIDSKFEEIIATKNWKWLPGKEALTLAIELEPNFWIKIRELNQSEEFKNVLESDLEIKEFIKKISNI
ncbi:MAG: ATP-binding protein [Candidatus Pacebacteria bacterium]|nr:ATP-binding protein [Candidatus Paceibacterota bacterium]